MNSRQFKYVRIQDHETTSTKTRVWTEHENPTPLQFDKFIPWICYEMRVPTQVIVERIIKEDSKLNGNRRFSSSRSKSIESTYASQYFDLTKVKESNFFSSSSLSGRDANTINIKSYYNQRNQLIEVAIIDCLVRINRKVIQAINLCLPFHEFFKKFVIKGGGLTETVLYEIGKFLPHSHITDVCLDDTYLPEGNYYVLFERINQLQNISLCRCKINDEVCKMIAHNLDFETPASTTLQTIDLTSNSITNLGASFLGFMLRKNRSLLYLNLSDNIIGDTGASLILRSLMLFKLTEDESIELKKRRFKYAAEKIKEYNKCEKEVRDRMKFEENKENASIMTPVSLKSEKGRSSQFVKPVEVPAIDKLLVKEQAERLTNKNIGEFTDIFDNEHVTYKDDKLYCIGNLKLCYLNLAYNDIKYFSIKKLCEVLKYQSSIHRSNCKGLLKVVIDGNNLPVGGELLETIQLYLKIAVKKCTPLRDSSRSILCGKKGAKKFHTGVIE